MKADVNGIDVGFDLEWVETLLTDLALAEPHRITLAKGAAAVLLMEARLHQLAPSGDRVARAQRLTSAITDGISEQPLHAGLWQGLTGVLYALEYARSVDPRLLGEEADAIAEFVGDTDTMLINFLKHGPRAQFFDLMSGQCGIGTYALMRTDHAAGATLFAAVQAALLAHAQRERGYCGWLSQPSAGTNSPNEMKRRAHYDLGVAHGTPGVLGLLAHAMRLGLGSGETGTLLAEGVNWLKTQQTPNLRYSRFQSMVEAQQPGGSARDSRLGWCYGDLGVAAMLASAEEAGGGRELGLWWRQLARDRLAQPYASFQIDSQGLCHGAAGIVHMLDRLMARGLHSVEASALSHKLRGELSHMLASGEGERSHCLLEGWAGVVLTLAEPGAQPRSESRPWNLCLLTPI